MEDPDEAWIDGEVVSVNGENVKVLCTSGKTVSSSLDFYHLKMFVFGRIPYYDFGSCNLPFTFAFKIPCCWSSIPFTYIIIFLSHTLKQLTHLFLWITSWFFLN